jgi:hypothetical protein
LSYKALQGLTRSKNDTQDPSYEVNICLTKETFAWPKEETGQVYSTLCSSIATFTPSCVVITEAYLASE